MAELSFSHLKRTPHILHERIAPIPRDTLMQQLESVDKHLISTIQLPEKRFFVQNNWLEKFKTIHITQLQSVSHFSTNTELRALILESEEMRKLHRLSDLVSETKYMARKAERTAIHLPNFKAELHNALRSRDIHYNSQCLLVLSRL